LNIEAQTPDFVKTSRIYRIPNKIAKRLNLLGCLAIFVRAENGKERKKRRY
jgi:hypothetical protein